MTACDELLAASLLSIGLAVPASAQGCNSMTGSLNCGGPSGFLPGVGEGLYGNSGRSGNLPPVSTLGGDLTGGDRPGTHRRRHLRQRRAKMQRHVPLGELLG